MNNITQLPKPAWASAVTTAEKLGPPQSIFLYGLPGTRKTSSAASIAKVSGFSKVLFIDVDNGTAVLSTEPEYANVEIVKIDPLDPNALAKIDGIVSDVAQNDYGYDAVVFDTLSVGQDVAEAALKAKYATAGKNGKPDGFAVYGDLGVWTDHLVRKLHNAPHFTGIITCHSTEKRDEAGNLAINPKLSGSSKESIGSIPDLVAHLSFARHPETNEKHLVATVGETPGLISKNRYRLDDVIVDFTLPRLYSLIGAKIGNQEASATAHVEATPAANAA